MFLDISGFFICTCQKNIVPLHREPALGMSVHRQRRVADIFKRRLLALCSDALKSRKFQSSSELSNDRCPTGYRLSLLCLYWYAICVYVISHTRTLTM